MSLDIGIDLYTYGCFKELGFGMLQIGEIPLMLKDQSKYSLCYMTWRQNRNTDDISLVSYF